MAEKVIQKILNKPMNRREFLAHVGAGVLTVVGVSGLIRTLTEYTGRSHRPSGYGSSSYGGGSSSKLR